METRPYVPWKLMNDFMIDVFKAYGVPEEDAKICADVLLESDRRGIESHGCNRFKPIYIDRIVKGTLLPKTQLEIVKETPTTIVMDAHDGMGMVAAHAMMKKLIQKAKECGMAGGAIRNSTHYGIAGYWTDMAAKQGLIAVTGTNARPSIAPTFGVENMLGTNPLTFSLPTDEEFPFCLDCATSIVQRGKIEFYARSGKDTPEGMVVTHDGKPITDSKAILKMLNEGSAALAPLGGGPGDEMCGYKGYGYATVVEILSSALAGGEFMKASAAYRRKAKRRCIISVTSSLSSTRRLLWVWMSLRRRPARFAANCALLPKHRDMRGSIQPAKKNTLSLWKEKIKECRSMKPYRKS